MNNISLLSSIKNHHHFSGLYRNKNQPKITRPDLFPRVILLLLHRNYQASSSSFIVSAAAAHWDKTPTTRRRRRRNHLRKKLHTTSSPVVVVVDKESSSNLSSSVVLNPVLVNQLETWPAKSSSSSSSVLHNNNNNNNNNNLIQQQQLISPFVSLPKVNKIGGICAFLLFIAFTASSSSSFLTKKQKSQDSITTRLDKEMLTRKFKARMAANKQHQNYQNTTTIRRDSKPELIPPQLDKQHLINTILSSNSTDFTPLDSHVSMPGNDLLDTQKPAAARIITSLKEARQYLHNVKLPNVPDFSAGNVSINNTNAKQETVNAKAALHRANRKKWMEDNFHEFQPIVDKIRAGFSNNYNLAKHKLKDDIVSDLKMLLQRDETETELEWMKDDKLTQIVFQVRENELMGRDPFYLMDDQDKAMFFKGLDNKVEKLNEKLCLLHQYLHSNIENLDYGADGISLYDPPEKIIPRWKGPPPATTMSQEFLDDYLHQRKSLFAETLGNSDLVKSDPQDSLQSTNKTVESKNVKSSKTVIEGSDGSVKPGKKSGKEFWQHTKKWSRGFIDSYNAENDPETKAVMKDIGKDLDRWITEKEIQATADIMDKVPDKGKKFISEKINKLKTEMELFGPQAVVSKYSEYGEEEEIDYYWWLDLPFLLCIELYIDGDEDERIGFYSLEMAADLELDPKPHHIIAFEDAGDCKNFCYIIQAHMEMLGNGNAFVVPQLPKDTYQEAKTNGFNVTVIRKGELKLDVDQTLEEVEEKLAEIGSKMYHDKIMKGRNVDVDSVMKGVFGLNKPPKRSRSKKKLKK